MHRLTPLGIRVSLLTAFVSVVAAITPPEQPTRPAVSTVTGLPRLDWSVPGGTTNILFFRIYRDGVGLADRYATTVTNDTFWIDSDPGTAASTSHTYSVSAVDLAFNESPLSQTVSWP